MKQILILITALALAGCAKSYSDVAQAQAQCSKHGGTLTVVNFHSAGTVQGYYCTIGTSIYYEGDF